jgi:hypothetical protein
MILAADFAGRIEANGTLDALGSMLRCREEHPDS